jgi:hypothetical protein
MKRVAALLLVLATAVPAFAEERPWQRLSLPTAAELQAGFAEPAPAYSAQFDYGFNPSRSREAIATQFDRAKAMNVHAVFVEPVRGGEPYLSPAYFEAVKVLVAEAKKRGMVLWFDDDGGYPSGFAGGKFSTERPDLRSMGLTAQRTPVTAGQQFSAKVSPETICVLAVNTDTGAAQVLESKDGAVSWTVPAGHWEIVEPRATFRSGPTRSANNGGGKTTEHSLMDYLNPEADKLFIRWTFDAYKEAIGDEFGKTVLGFRGDEPSYNFNPWSPVLLSEFQKRKGYDLRPYLASVAAITIGRRNATEVSLDEGHRTYADYCDVWSDLFGENFFAAEGAWAAANGIEMQTHIEHEEILPQLAIANGDFFKCMRGIQVPGVDVIWHQMWHDVVADFPKLASSAAHLNGRPRAMCEVFAAFNPQPDLKEAGWILNHLFVNGISRIEYMGLQSNGPPRNFYADPGFPALSAHVNRTTFVLGEGHPTAQIGVYIPSTSFWFNDAQADSAFRGIVHELLGRQRDLDFVDEHALSTSLKRQGTELVNASGQAYRAILVPPVTAMSKTALENLRAFAAAGGRVIFFGGPPKLVMDRNFLTAAGPADISWAKLAPEPHITPEVLAALPAPDVVTDKPTDWLKYNHRRLKDGELYFFFNEGEQPLSLNVTVGTASTGQSAQRWDTYTGKAEAWPSAALSAGKATVPLELPAWGTTVLVIRE